MLGRQMQYLHCIYGGFRLAHGLAIAMALGFLCSQQVEAYQHGVSMFPKSNRQSKSTTMLVPYIMPRSLVKRDQTQFVLQAGKPVELVYGEGLIAKTSPATIDPFISIVKFQPAPHRTILVLEDYLHGLSDNGLGFFEKIECQSQEVILTFTETGEIWEAFAHWVEVTSRDKLQEIVVVTTSEVMLGCGVKERKAFLVNTANFNGLTANFHVTEILWSDVAITASVEFGRVSTRPSLKKRLNIDINLDIFDNFNIDPQHNFTETVQIEKIFDFGPRLPIYPLPDISSVIDIGFPFDIPFLGGEDSKNNDTTPAAKPPLQVTCVNCGLEGELVFSGMFDWSIGAKAFEAGLISVHVIQDLVARLDMEFATGSTPFSFQFEQSVFPIIGMQDGVPLSAGFGISQILTITPYFDFSIGISVEVGAPETNTTVGGELRIPHGASLTWDIVQGNSTETSGWDVEAKINPVKVNKVNMTDFSLGVNITSTPAVVVKLELLDALDKLPVTEKISAEVGAKVSMALPRLYTKSTLVKDVTEACTAPGPDEYTYYPYGVAFESGLELALYGELFATVAFNFSKTVGVEQGKNFVQKLWSHAYPFKDACLLFGNSETGLGDLRNITAADEQVFDLKKIEAAYAKTGKIPPGVDEQKLSQVEGLADDLKHALEQSGEGTSYVTTPETSGGSQLQVSAWTLAVFEFGILFFM